ncbi:MAG: hypothetical protein R3323_01500 [Wenzhouxiangellaceae bacterium]|nr:hypothetical protein [Wenzhouxiangellaceae bacterium]
MKILALLAAFGLLIPVARPQRFRDTRWLAGLVRRAGGSDQPSWLPVLAILATALLVGALAVAVFEALLGRFGALLVGTATVFLTLGPRSLDDDVRHAAGDDDPEERAAALRALHLDRTAPRGAAAAAALHAALARWFGVIFWFVVLGVPGALLYRAVRIARHVDTLTDGQRARVRQLLAVLNWPVVALVTASVGLMTDLDRAAAAFRSRSDRWDMPAALLDDLAAGLCEGEGGLAEGLEDGRRLAGRVLALWLVVLSVLLLAGWLS